jgi:hypothetical protein
LNKAGFSDRLVDLKLILGTPSDIPQLSGTPVVVGKCAHNLRHLGVYVPGCPPHGITITDTACDVLGIDRKSIHEVIETLHNF